MSKDKKPFFVQYTNFLLTKYISGFDIEKKEKNKDGILTKLFNMNLKNDGILELLMTLNGITSDENKEMNEKNNKIYKNLQIHIFKLIIDSAKKEGDHYEIKNFLEYLKYIYLSIFESEDENPERMKFNYIDFKEQKFTFLGNYLDNEYCRTKNIKKEELKNLPSNQDLWSMIKRPVEGIYAFIEAFISEIYNENSDGEFIKIFNSITNNFIRYHYCLRNYIYIFTINYGAKKSLEVTQKINFNRDLKVVNFYFIRHGFSCSNAGAPIPDPSLMKKGVKDSIKAGDEIKNLIGLENFDNYFCSSLLRTWETALLMFPNAHGIYIAPHLRERNRNYDPDYGNSYEKNKERLNNFFELLNKTEIINFPEIKNIENKIIHFNDFEKKINNENSDGYKKVGSVVDFMQWYYDKIAPNEIKNHLNVIVISHTNIIHKDFFQEKVANPDILNVSNNNYCIKVSTNQDKDINSFEIDQIIPIFNGFPNTRVFNRNENSYKKDKYCLI